jgi:hypothetical protein
MNQLRDSGISFPFWLKSKLMILLRAKPNRFSFLLPEREVLLAFFHPLEEYPD